MDTRNAVDSDTGISFGSWVKARRKALGLTQGDLARQTACSVETIRKIEGGTYRPSQQLGVLLAVSLEIAPAEHAAFLEFARPRPTTPLPRLPAGIGKPPQSARPAGNMPLPPTSFIGRERELAMISQLLHRDDVHLLTLTGPPGIGKTRLAIQAARAVHADFAAGVLFIPLAPIRDPAHVAPTIAQALGVREMGGHPLQDSLLTFLHDRQMLLVLDNFEQVITAAPLLAALVAGAPQV
jgi:transcriptional regulator with XRE-family HTH domain